MTEFGNLALIEQREEGDVSIKLPGVKKGDMAARSFKPEVRIFGIKFSPTGKLFDFLVERLFNKQTFVNRERLGRHFDRRTADLFT
jgi:hypothetical protein